MDAKELDAIFNDYDALERDTRLKYEKLQTKPIKNTIDYENEHKLTRVLNGIDSDRQSILDNNRWYKRGDGSVEQPAEAESPGILSDILSGAKATGKFALQHPGRAAHRALLGAGEFAALPFTAPEALLVKPENRILGPMFTKQREALQKEEEAEGVTGVGPSVTEAVGTAALPVGPTLQAGKTLKNVLKGGAFTGGAYTAEKVVADQPVDSEGLATSTAVGGGLAGIIGKILGKVKGNAGVTAKEHVAETGEGTATSDPVGGPKIPSSGTGGGTAKTSDGVVKTPPESEGVIVGPQPDKDQKILPFRKKGDEQFAGLKQILRPGQPEEVNLSAGTPMGEAKAGIEEELALRAASPEPVVKQPVAMVAKPKPQEDPVALVQQVDKEKDNALKELELGQLLKGEKDISQIKPPKDKRPKKEKAPVVEPAAGAVEGQAPPIDLESEKLIFGKDIPEGFQKSTEYLPTKLVENFAEFKRGTPGDVKSPEYVQRMVDAIRRQGGIRDPLIIEYDQQTRKALLVEGNSRLAAAKIAGLEQVPVRVIRRTSTGGVTSKKGQVVKGVEPNEFDYVPGELRPSDIGIATEKSTITPARRTKMEAFLKSINEPEPGVGGTPTRLEDFIKAQKYGIKEREPFPGEKAYDISTEKGDLIARGDREALVNALQHRPEAKGMKLYSFPAGLDDLASSMTKKLKDAGARIPDDVEVKGPQYKGGPVHEALRSIERPQFHWRGNKPGSAIEDAAITAERGVDTRYRDLLYTRDPAGEYKETGFFKYLSLPKVSKDKVNKVLVYGDKTSEDFTGPEGNARLAKLGLTPEEILSYNGVRKSLDDILHWVQDELKARVRPDDAKRLKEIESSFIKGYVPHVWGGSWEIYKDGTKFLRSDGSSSFDTLQDAAAKVHELKSSDPKSKIAIRHFADEHYMHGRALQDARLVRRLKANMEALGTIDTKVVDEAYRMGRNIKGFAKHLLQRRNEVGYDVENLDEVLQAYSYRAAKFVEMSKMKRTVDQIFKDHKNDLSAEQVSYLQNYIERVAGKPAADQVMIENYISRTPLGRWLAPGFSQRAVHTAEQLNTHLSLGLFNVAWAAINIDSLARHTWPGLARELSTKATGRSAEAYMIDGIQSFFNDKKLMRKLAHEGAIDIQFLTEPLPTLKPHAGKWTPERVSMALGSATEEFNRGVTAIARYKMALDQGMNEEGAIHAAARFVDFTQGRYTTAGKPLALTGLTGRTIGQFKTFMVAMLENGWVNMQQPGSGVRYMMATLGLSGLAGLPFAGDIDKFITERFGWSPLEETEKHIPKGLMTGLAGFLPGMLGEPKYNVDLSRKAGYPDIIPNDTMSALGPIINRFGGAVVSVLNGETDRAIDKLLPSSIRPLVQLKRGEGRGMDVAADGRPISRLSPEEQRVKATGFTPVKESKEQEIYGRNIAKIEYANHRKHLLTRLIASGKATPEDFKEYAELGGTNRGIKEEYRAQEEPAIERQFRHLPKILRQQQSYQ